jgi:hypothetical protein
MIVPAEGDPAEADRYLAQASELAEAIGAAALPAEISLHRAVSSLAAGDTGTAQRLAGQAGAAIAEADHSHSRQLTLQHLALSACLAMAAGRTAEAAAIADRMARRARATHQELEAQAARRISAAARAGGPHPLAGPAAYPRLLWIAGQSHPAWAGRPAVLGRAAEPAALSPPAPPRPASP